METIKIKEIQGKIEYIDNVINKIESIDNWKKIFAMRDLKKYKEQIKIENLKAYTKEKYLNSKADDELIKKWKKQYQITKIKDIKSDMHPNYLQTIEERLKSRLKLDESSTDFYIYVYMLYSLSDMQNHIYTTEETINSTKSFYNSEEYLKNKWYYEWKADKLIKYEKANKYSRNDYLKVTCKN